MSEVTRILTAIDEGNEAATDKLLPLVYDELRSLAAVKLAKERSDHTLQPTALVHEAYIRLVQGDAGLAWNSRGHFFAAAAEAMRRILIDAARRRQSERRGGDRRRQPLHESQLSDQAGARDEQLLAVSQALEDLKMSHPVIGGLVELRYFAGLTIEQSAQALGISTRSANRYWVYAKAWLGDRVKSLQ